MKPTSWGSKEIILLLLAGVLLLAIVAMGIFLLLRTSPAPGEPQAQITPPPTSFTQQEEAYPPATPQPFRNPGENEMGSLVVTASTDDVEVFLDATEHPDPEDPIPSGQKWPVNRTPFTVDAISVGKHFLFAAKPPNYDTQVVEFEIKPGEVTRVHIEMFPLRTSN